MSWLPAVFGVGRLSLDRGSYYATEAWLPGRLQTMNEAKPYLSICSMYRDHAEYLTEWIEFHRLVGVERFFLYDNESTDSHLEVLAPYIEQGVVEVTPWPGFPFMVAKGDPSKPPFAERPAPGGLGAAFDDCLKRHRHDSRWIAFIDIDEFLFSPTALPLPEVLAEFEAWPGVAVSRVNFGTSGHRQKPPGLVIENFLHRRSYPPGHKDLVKSVVDPARTVRSLSVHTFLYDDGVSVDERCRPLDVLARTNELSMSKLRINHYISKSEEEYQGKLARWAVGLREEKHPRSGMGREWLDLHQAEYDDEITSYVPALKKALAHVRA